MYNIAVIQFPGANCDRDAAQAVNEIHGNMQGVLVNYNGNLKPLENADGIIIPGGFTYDDRGRAGLIAARNSGVMDIIKSKAENGAPVLGICNGTQIGLEAKLLGEGIDIAMAPNAPQKNSEVARTATGFLSRYVTLRYAQGAGRTAFTLGLQNGETLEAPIAHGEGNYQMSRETFEILVREGMIAFQYCDANGDVSPELPVNPNGSIANIAGLCNKRGNVLLMMPHPERLVRGDFGKGLSLFGSILNYLEKGENLVMSSAEIQGEYSQPSLVAKIEGDYYIDILARWLTTDGTEFTVAKNADGIDSLNRTDLHRVQVTGEFSEAAALDLAERILQSATVVKLNKHEGIVALPNGKRFVYHPDDGFSETALPQGKVLNVFPRWDYSGQSTAKLLDLDEVASVHSGVQWIADGDGLDALIESRLFHHPLLHDLYKP